ncbi:hypothetical protein SAMN05444354_13128 [Stigmatella aurantiaca]|uniref:Biopterin-dependent aromatic amino acid hydroxylase family profile domain-containing protein n=1 Tax=Stigmatella aurantiaca TaxID=41 RepID=A0A1H8DYY2_STIAU|nr:hypothetical protein [Stigmatella aurantiaca]SEN11738.1 hypothetical protein SAMN05444354_13128 [Stigmatella aurantiaca]
MNRAQDSTRLARLDLNLVRVSQSTVSQALARLRDEAARRIISGAGLLSLAAE